VLRYHHSDDTAQVEDAKDKEEIEESLGVATEIDTIIFLVTLTRHASLSLFMP